MNIIKTTLLSLAIVSSSTLVLAGEAPTAEVINDYWKRIEAQEMGSKPTYSAKFKVLDAWYDIRVKSPQKPILDKFKINQDGSIALYGRTSDGKSWVKNCVADKVCS